MWPTLPLEIKATTILIKTRKVWTSKAQCKIQHAIDKLTPIICSCWDYKYQEKRAKLKPLELMNKTQAYNTPNKGSHQEHRNKFSTWITFLLKNLCKALQVHWNFQQTATFYSNKKCVDIDRRPKYYYVALLWQLNTILSFLSKWTCWYKLPDSTVFERTHFIWWSKYEHNWGLKTDKPTSDPSLTCPTAIIWPWSDSPCMQSSNTR